jgi:hypothetical protein
MKITRETVSRVLRDAANKTTRELMDDLGRAYTGLTKRQKKKTSNLLRGWRK